MKLISTFVTLKSTLQVQFKRNYFEEKKKQFELLEASHSTNYMF